MPLPQNLRLPNRKEHQRWNREKQRVDTLHNRGAGVTLILDNLAIADRFARSVGINRQFLDPELERRWNRTSANILRLKNAFEAVERNELAVSFQNGDFNIVGPTTEDPTKYQPYQLSGFPIIAIAVIGVVVVVAGVVAAITAMNRDVEEMRAESLKEMRSAEKTFCKDLNSDVCRQWLEKEQSTGYAKNKGVIDWVFDTGKGVGAGLGLGAAVLAGLWLWSRSKKNG